MNRLDLSDPLHSTDKNSQKTTEMNIIRTPFESSEKDLSIDIRLQIFFYSTCDVNFVRQTDEKQSRSAPFVFSCLMYAWWWCTLVWWLFRLTCVHKNNRRRMDRQHIWWRSNASGNAQQIWLARLQILYHFGFAAANMLLRWNHPAGVVNITWVFAPHLTAIITFTTCLGKFMNRSLVNVNGAWTLVIDCGLCMFLVLMMYKAAVTPYIKWYDCILCLCGNWVAHVIALGSHLS